MCQLDIFLNRLELFLCFSYCFCDVQYDCKYCFFLGGDVTSIKTEAFSIMEYVFYFSVCPVEHLNGLDSEH